ncbi:ComEC/Rec2 family competence protein [Rhodopseudomonas sp.]|uniref:ComEC/Rec2 family competence protein n=1 Tax=Rhodopseudomonas sp. TaxID=1078 RepID=UPI0039E23A4C
MFEIDFLPVGDSNGDAICIRYGNDNQGYYVHVVDGGYTDTADTIIKHIEEHYGAGYFINNMVLSHADNDHAMGLIGVMKRFEVKNLWMNRPWLYAAEILPHMHGNYTLPGLIDKIREMHPYLVELEDLATQKGTVIHDAFQGASIGPFTVLAPSRERYIDLLPDLDKTPTSYRADAGTTLGGLLKGLVEAAKEWFDETWDIETLSNNPDPTSASNETSVVQYGVIEGRRILLTADVGPAGLNEAADYLALMGVTLAPNFVQVPHHGSRRNVTPAVLDRLLGPIVGKGEKHGSAYCSVGKNKPEYPRGQVQNAFERRGFPVYVTRGDAKCHHHQGKLRKGWVAAEPEPFADKVEA